MCNISTYKLSLCSLNFLQFLVTVPFVTYNLFYYLNYIIVPYLKLMPLTVEESYTTGDNLDQTTRTPDLHEYSKSDVKQKHFKTLFRK